jgi:hypothetical protein
VIAIMGNMYTALLGGLDDVEALGYGDGFSVNGNVHKCRSLGRINSHQTKMAVKNKNSKLKTRHSL